MNRSGRFVSNLSGDMEYKSFYPNPLPPSPPLEMDDEMIALLLSANKHLSSLESIVSQIPSMQLFISMYVRKEALMSSQIEGTQTTLEDVLDPNISANANRNVADVVNYVKATEYAIERLKTLPLCNRLIREAHNVLMQNVRGSDKNPGEFRHSQNWIGGQGSSLKNARYIPPNVSDMQNCISDLEKYLHDDNDNLDNLIRAALIHYQFETIHPFLDGNGRIGRLLITLFLMEKKVLSSPALYISYFLKKNRIEYYDRMTEVRNKGNYEQWIKFFLRAVSESAQDAFTTIIKLNALRQKNLNSIQTLYRSANTVLLFDYLEKNPIIDIQKTAKALNLSFNTVSNAVKNLLSLNILSENTSNLRNRTFVYTEYLDILRDGTDNI